MQTVLFQLIFESKQKNLNKNLCHQFFESPIKILEMNIFRDRWQLKTREFFMPKQTRNNSSQCFRWMQVQYVSMSVSQTATFCLDFTEFTLIHSDQSLIAVRSAELNNHPRAP